MIGLYKAECVRRDGPWRTVDDLELATLSWVHWFNTTRLHAKVGNIPPVEFEQQLLPLDNARAGIRSRETQPPLPRPLPDDGWTDDRTDTDDTDPDWFQKLTQKPPADPQPTIPTPSTYDDEPPF